ncbi:MAG: hypothetical protein CVV21_01385 [Candidatus Goldiibacteriota bacterium HGW-Goldbacteria-1]|jgi:hypothetical protein|nr:MAG: hypothetical protein CVV21_01385 [Candidatus Goldiibacteriota bacterium HGW-Goldbacteria-1]
MAKQKQLLIKFNYYPRLVVCFFGLIISYFTVSRINFSLNKLVLISTSVIIAGYILTLLFRLFFANKPAFIINNEGILNYTKLKPSFTKWEDIIQISIKHTWFYISTKTSKKNFYIPFIDITPPELEKFIIESGYFKHGINYNNRIKTVFNNPKKIFSDFFKFRKLKKSLRNIRNAFVAIVIILLFIFIPFTFKDIFCPLCWELFVAVYYMSIAWFIFIQYQNLRIENRPLHPKNVTLNHLISLPVLIIMQIIGVLILYNKYGYEEYNQLRVPIILVIWIAVTVIISLFMTEEKKPRHSKTAINRSSNNRIDG